MFTIHFYVSTPGTLLQYAPIPIGESTVTEWNGGMEQWTGMVESQIQQVGGQKVTT